MVAWDKRKLMEHYGHDVTVAYYGHAANPIDVTIECLDCGTVLVSAEDLAAGVPTTEELVR